MNINRKRLSMAVAAGAAGFVSPASADFDQWRISEVFTNADAAIQYVELETTAMNQGDVAGLVLTAINADGQQQNNATLMSDLSGDTSNRNLLIATESFAELTGLNPDLLVPDGFLFTEGGSINFANGTAIIEYAARQLPKNGVQSIDGNGAAISPGPTNFAGLSATLSVETNASFDAAASVVVLPVVDVPGIGLARVSFDVSLASLEFALRNDFYIYTAGILAGNTPAQLQAGGILYTPRLVVANELFEFNLSLLSDDPVVFGNPVVLSVSNLLPLPEAEPEPTPESTPEPTPDPEPEPSGLQLSIDRGQLSYQSLCAVCHGVTGTGFSAPALTTSIFNTFTALRQKTDSTMSPGNATACTDTGSSTCATDVANFMLNVFQN
jgi:cytochrome c553